MDDIKDVEFVEGADENAEVADQTPVVETEPVVTDVEVVEPVVEPVVETEISEVPVGEVA